MTNNTHFGTTSATIDQLIRAVKAWSQEIKKLDTNIQEVQTQLTDKLESTKTELEGSIAKIQERLDSFGSFDNDINVPMHTDSVSVF